MRLIVEPQPKKVCSLCKNTGYLTGKFVCPCGIKRNQKAIDRYHEEQIEHDIAMGRYDDEGVEEDET